jgi:hypothetical protein
MAKRAAKERRGEEAEPPPDGIPQALEERRLLRSRYLAVKSQINGTGLLARIACVGAGAGSGLPVSGSFVSGAVLGLGMRLSDLR